MRTDTFFKSVKCAFNGIFMAFNSEKNYKIYIGISLFFLFLNIYFKVGLIGHLCHFITTMGVFSAECFNTAIEKFIDMVDKEIKPEIKFIKDVAAGGVLYWGFAFFISEFMVIGSVLL